MHLIDIDVNTAAGSACCWLLCLQL